MRVLIVDDDAELAANLAAGLGHEGIGSAVVSDPAAADVPGVAAGSDVVVLDLMLGSLDGLDVSRQLRCSGVATPILMLTARDSVADRVRGLEAGADDYLVKPFALEELVARVRALVRRGLPERGAVIDVGGLRFDTRTRRAEVGGRPGDHHREASRLPARARRGRGARWRRRMTGAAGAGGSLRPGARRSPWPGRRRCRRAARSWSPPPPASRSSR